MKRKILAGVVIVALASGAFAGCEKDPEKTPEQDEWIELFEEWYPDDEFEYLGHDVGFMGSRNASVIVLGSKLFPDYSFRVAEQDGEIVSDYPAVYHSAAIEEHYEELVADVFDCDEIDVKYNDVRIRLVHAEYMSDEDFIREYATNLYTVYLQYDRISDLPPRDEMIVSILQYVYSTDDCELQFIYCHSGSSDYDYRYDIKCYDGTIKYFVLWTGNSTDTEDIARDMTIDDAMELYDA